MKRTILLKFINGEEVIARVESEHDGAYVVSKPLTFHVVRQNDGSIGAQLVPSLMGASETADITVPRNALMMCTEPSKDLEDKYLEMTSGIQLATNSIVK